MKSNYAETKTAKFGETLTDNADGNPEPSSEVGEGVETRRRLCIHCNNEIPKTKRKNAKFCSTKCRTAYNTYQWCLRNNNFEKPGVGSGGNQFGKNNHMYKTGIGIFSKRALAHYGKKCNRCDSIKNLLVHHIDEDRTNNQLDNLEVLCKRCHQEHHCNRDAKTGKYIKG